MRFRPSVLAMAPSTERLVLSVQYLITHMADLKHTAMARMVGHSLLGDGQFAKAVFRQTRRSVFEFLTQGLEAAIEAGDIADAPEKPELLWWMIQHLGFGLKLTGLSGARTTSYGVRRDDVVDLAVRFCLRGIGLNEALIDRHYDPETFDRSRAA